eukprot:scaffold197559_cov28-Tisochrysis_lutea.AAC.2
MQPRPLTLVVIKHYLTALWGRSLVGIERPMRWAAAKLRGERASPVKAQLPLVAMMTRRPVTCRLCNIMYRGPSATPSAESGAGEEGWVGGREVGLM